MRGRCRRTMSRIIHKMTLICGGVTIVRQGRKTMFSVSPLVLLLPGVVGKRLAINWFTKASLEGRQTSVGES